MSQSQTPGGSTTGRRQRHSADNPRGKKPTSLSYYRYTEVHAPLTEVKESFAATAFSSGFLFYHQNSHHRKTFKMYARDAIGQAANADMYVGTFSPPSRQANIVELLIFSLSLCPLCPSVPLSHCPYLAILPSSV
jgi:hypothetical protein